MSLNSESNDKHHAQKSQITNNIMKNSENITNGFFPPFYFNTRNESSRLLQNDNFSECATCCGEWNKCCSKTIIGRYINNFYNISQISK